MQAHKMTLICALSLIGFGLWGALADGTADIHPTAFIPVAFGVILLLLVPGVKKENKVVAHIAVVLVLLVLASLIAKPLMGALESQEPVKILRVGAMVLTSFLALVSYVQSFIRARKNK